MKVLTDEQAAALAAFLDAFDIALTGAWAPVEAAMRDDFGISDPEDALEDARRALE